LGSEEADFRACKYCSPNGSITFSVGPRLDKNHIGLEQGMQHKKATNQVSGQARLEPAMKELVEVVSSLRQLLLDYGPLWYTEETDARVHNALAEADSALPSSVIQRGRYPNTRCEDEENPRKPAKKNSYPSLAVHGMRHLLLRRNVKDGPLCGLALSGR